MIRVSAPGKVHLIGEHAVVYGKPAILAAIGKRTTIQAERSEKIDIEMKMFQRRIEKNLEDARRVFEKAEEFWKHGYETKNFNELFRFLKSDWNNYYIVFTLKALKELGIDGGVHMIITSDLPWSSGLGFSASLGVAIAKAVAEVYEIKIGKERVNEIAYEIEKFAHGKPSGGDNAAVCFGGLTWFRKGRRLLIKSLKNEIPHKLENFVFVYTKKPEKTTGELVQMVMNLSEERRTPVLNKIEELTYEMKDVLKRKDYVRMKEIINLAQENLAKLGVSIPGIDKICKKVKDIGGCAKLCGAGGGGIVLCWHENKEKLLNTLKQMGLEPWEADLGVEGVVVEE